MMQRSRTQSLTHSARLATLAALFFFAGAAWTGVALAARSAWVQTQGGAVRLVAGPREADGTIPAILDIRLEPGWKTYWTNPGSSGIPPEVSVTGKGIVFSGLRLPAPRRFGEGTAEYAGYERPVAFPLMLRSDAPLVNGTIRASVFLGFCKAICIPVQATLDLSLTGPAADNALDAARIRTAFSALPQAPSDDFRVTQARFDAKSRAIALSLRLPDGAETPDLFLSGPSGYGFGTVRTIDRQDGIVRMTVDVRRPDNAAPAPADGAIRLTVSAGGRAMETPLVFDPALSISLPDRP